MNAKTAVDLERIKFILGIDPQSALIAVKLVLLCYNMRQAQAVHPGR